MVETLREKQEVGGTRGPNTEDEPVQRIMGNFYKVHRAVFGDPHFDQQALYTNKVCSSDWVWSDLPVAPPLVVLLLCSSSCSSLLLLILVSHSALMELTELHATTTPTIITTSCQPCDVTAHRWTCRIT